PPAPPPPSEPHHNRSIACPASFTQTNVAGTQIRLETSVDYWSALDGDAKPKFRFVHVSTDEVFGSLPVSGHFTETSPYAPNSPYAASKAAADHLARAWYTTYGLPVSVTNCSNNYGPYQFPEKLIPLTISKALAGEPLPVYGRGDQVRDWIHVEDHVRALRAVLERGRIGGSYNIGGRCERKNVEVVEAICGVLDRRPPRSSERPRRRRSSFVSDRPGDDPSRALRP